METRSIIGRPWWWLPVHSELLVRTELVPADQVPREHRELKPWLDRRWARVDTWVTARTRRD